MCFSPTFWHEFHFRKTIIMTWHELLDALLKEGCHHSSQPFHHEYKTVGCHRRSSPTSQIKDVFPEPLFSFLWQVTVLHDEITETPGGNLLWGLIQKLELDHNNCFHLCPDYVQK